MSLADEDTTTGWLLTTPLDVVNAALASAVAVTSSIFGFFSVCLPCRTDFNGCFGKKKDFANKAWFDSDQLQTEYPFCYANPMPVLTEDRPTDEHTTNHNGTTLCSPSQDFSTSFDESFIVDKETSIAIVESYDGEVTQIPNGEVHKSTSKRPRFKKHRNRSLKSNFFTSNLEQDRIHVCRKDSFRSEGKIQSPPIRRAKEAEGFSTNHVPSIRSPILQRKTLPPFEIDFIDSFSWDEYSFESDDGLEIKEFQQSTFGNVWRPSELEEAFEGYNEFALRSFGFKSQNNFIRGSSHRKSNEKFEDFFPSCFNKPLQAFNEDSPIVEEAKSTISDANLIIEAGSEYRDESLELPSSHSSHVVTDVTHEDIRSYVKTFLFIENLREADHSKDDPTNYKFHCDNLLNYDGKSFNKYLIFDLVKQMMNEYLIEYKSSVLLRSNYPENIIYDKVISHLRLSRHRLSSDSFITQDIQVVRRTMMLTDNVLDDEQDFSGVMIKKLLSEESVKESKFWQNIDEEKTEVKLKISDEIFSSLLTTELCAICDVLKSKESSLMLQET